MYVCQRVGCINHGEERTGKQVEIIPWDNASPAASVGTVNLRNFSCYCDEDAGYANCNCHLPKLWCLQMKPSSIPATTTSSVLQHGSVDSTHTVTEKRVTVAKRHIPATIASFVLQGGSAEASVENDATHAVREKRVTVAKRRHLQQSSKTGDCQCIVCSEWYSATVSGE